MASTTPQATDDEPLTLRARIERLLAEAPAGERLGRLQAVLATVMALETARAAVADAVTALENEPGVGSAEAAADPRGIKRLRMDAVVELAAKSARVALPDLRDEWGVAPSDYLAHPELMTLSGPQRRELVQEQRYAVAKCTYEALREKLNKPDEYGITPSIYKAYPRLKLLAPYQRFPQLAHYKSRGNQETDEIERNEHRETMTQLRHEGAAARFSTVLAEHHSNALMDAVLDKPLSKLIFGEQPGSLLKRIERIVKSAVAPGQPGPDASPDA